MIERVPGTEVTDPPHGTPSGTLRETAADLMTARLPDYTVDQYKEAMHWFQDEIAAPLGLTTVFDPILYIDGNATQALEEMARDGELTVRIRAALEITPEDDLTDWIKAAKAERAKHTHGMFKTPAVKVFADGVVEGHTAYLAEPYADAEEYKGDPDFRGEPIWQPAAMNEAFRRLDKAGFQIHVHSIGDAATSETLDALAYARKANGKRDWRPGITHLQLVAPGDFARFAKLGVVAVPDPYWFLKDDYYTYLQVPYLGQQRADDEYPMRSFFKAGVTVASASDFPVTLPPAPLTGVAVGVTRWDPVLVTEYPAPPSLEGILWPAERASVKQMIRSFTLDDAKANFLEKRIGSIKVGKRADLVLHTLDRPEMRPTSDMIRALVFASRAKSIRSVIVDGRAVVSCAQKARRFEGKHVITQEGLSAEERLRWSECFVTAGASQCGYCSPGIVMKAEALLHKHPDPTREEIEHALLGNLCRCTGYVKVIDAIELDDTGSAKKSPSTYWLEAPSTARATR